MQHTIMDRVLVRIQESHVPLCVCGKPPGAINSRPLFGETYVGSVYVHTASAVTSDPHTVTSDRSSSS